MDGESAEAALAQSGKPEPEKPEPTPEPTPEPEPEPEPTPEPTPTPEPEPAPKAPDKTPRVRSQFSQRELDAIALKNEAKKEHGTDLSLDECLRMVDERSTPSPAPQPEPTVSIVTTLEQQLTGLNDALAKAKDEDEESEEVQRLQDQRAELLGRIGAAKHEEANARKSQFRDIRQKSRARALSQFSQLSDPNSALNREVSQLISEMGDENHPDHADLLLKDAPEVIASRAANRLIERTAIQQGITEDEARTLVLGTAKAAPAVPVQQKVKPAGGPSAAPGTSQTVTTDDLLGPATLNGELADEILNEAAGKPGFFHL